jgi:hypothetical protein
MIEFATPELIASRSWPKIPFPDTPEFRQEVADIEKYVKEDLGYKNFRIHCEFKDTVGSIDP